MPRVIAGSAGGVPLAAPKGKSTRPTLDRTKEAMFSAITARIELEGARVLDCFAGSGQLGIEAISRGAEHAVLVESNAGARQIIKQNLEKTGFGGRSMVLALPMNRALERLLEEGERYDLILLDPPYGEAIRYFTNLCEKGLGSLLKPHGLLVLEHASSDETVEFVKDLKQIKRCKYGTAMLSFYESEDIA